MADGLAAGGFALIGLWGIIAGHAVSRTMFTGNEATNPRSNLEVLSALRAKARARRFTEASGEKRVSGLYFEYRATGIGFSGLSF
ncbi:hypothetical protein [Stutzerimonas frequens]|uniref:hypothetical protein n=1 Tax=Stutzerimonas frequens TaxID=2968969 RepID=UPI001E4368A1|nr:hypothetical protein [Stutzerimonas frequens]